ncbi:MAG TPA: N-acetylmuramoyl-L-alanine amidase [Myxococcota bacterium]|jgi:N-acetylmuramoyl-L-alanine amidase|nr:N-acetylmuramoyl-L-alanine amidase [Myxococcota bacterium]
MSAVLRRRVVAAACAIALAACAAPAPRRAPAAAAASPVVGAVHPATDTSGAAERGLAAVLGVRHWSYPGFTRVAIELDRGVRYQVVRLPADPGASRPERLYLDLDGVWIGHDFTEPIRIGDGLLQGVRLGQNTSTRTRVVIDLLQYGRHRVVALERPDRVVIDVFGAREATDAARTGPPPVSARAVARSPVRGPARAVPSAAPAPPPEPAQPPLIPIQFADVVRPVHTVVLDPGHGGKDPGAIGIGGLTEKDVTLFLAKRLRAKLVAQGFRVVLTREADETLDLEERTAIAEGALGDVFVSLHCNAAESPQLHGIETYSLDESDERHDAHVAARENGVPPAEVDVLQRTVAQLRVSEVAGPSADLASLAHHGLMARARERQWAVHDLGVKKGPFYVLFLATMPSILVETGFVTNPQDAKRLGQERYLDTLAEGLAAGIGAYRARVAPVVAKGSR